MAAEAKVGKVRLHLHETNYKLGHRSQYHTEVSARNRNVGPLGVVTALTMASLKSGAQRVLVVSSTVTACSTVATALSLLGVTSGRVSGNTSEDVREATLADTSIRGVTMSVQMLEGFSCAIYKTFDAVILADLLTPRVMASIMDKIAAVALAERRVINVHMVKDTGNFADQAFRTLHKAATTILPGLKSIATDTSDVGDDVHVPDAVKIAVVDAIARIGASKFVTGGGRVAGTDQALADASAVRAAKVLEPRRHKEPLPDVITRLTPLWVRDLKTAPACKDLEVAQTVVGDIETGITVTLTIKPAEPPRA